MKFNPEIHRRRSIRLQDYDYSRIGAYFITICVQNQSCLFGKITGEKIILNDAGKMVQEVWDEFSAHYLESKPTNLLSCLITFMELLFLLKAHPPTLFV